MSRADLLSDSFDVSFIFIISLTGPVLGLGFCLLMILTEKIDITHVAVTGKIKLKHLTEVITFAILTLRYLLMKMLFTVIKSRL